MPKPSTAKSASVRRTDLKITPLSVPSKKLATARPRLANIEPLLYCRGLRFNWGRFRSARGVQMARAYDVTTIGSAIVDIIATVDEEFLLAHDIARGVMTLIDE